MANFLNDSVFKKYLYNYTIGQYNDVKNLTGLFISPIVQTPTLAGNIMTYDNLDAFQVDDTTRQPGQSATMVAFKGTPVSYNMTPNALDSPIDQAILDMSDQETAGIHYETVARYLVSRAHTALEYQTWANISGSVSAAAGYGANWSIATGSNSATSPMSEIEDLYYQIGRDTGVLPNRMVVGPDAWRYMKYSYTAKGTFPAHLVNEREVKEFYSNIGAQPVEIKIAFAGYGSNKGQTTRTITNIVNSKDVFLFYASENPDLMDRSAFKTLQYGQGLSNLRSYLTPDQRTTVMALDWYVQPGFLANKYAVKRITVT